MDDKLKLLSKMTHDLRNPLGVVLAYSQLLERALAQTDGADPRMVRQVQGVLKAAQRMEELIETYSVTIKSQAQAPVAAEAVSAATQAPVIAPNSL